ncbi:hypothetical protein [Pantoea endophytica]|uniref:hypothetical protein n=1 Tax=Pantoea endophytica TaxID=92488 RepID=UPI0024139642|nr:hypothetical protein [Pantoea endophytica]
MKPVKPQKPPNEAVFYCLQEIEMTHPDPIDAASELELQMIELALAYRQRVTATLTGKCLWCDEPIDKGHYCDTECRSDHEKDLRAIKHRRANEN